MAEAHNIQDLPRIGHGKRAMRLQLDDGGLHLACTVTVPPPRKALRASMRYADSWRRWIYNAVFPWGWAVFLIVVALVITVVVRAESGSWWRNGWLAHAIWWIGEQFPWVPGVPLAVKVGVLAAWAAVLGAILVASVQRLLLRALLSWTGYMFLGHGQATLWSKTWAILVKLLSGFGRPLTFSYQSVLPPLPLPPLEDTVSRYLESARAVITSPKDREALQSKADAFLAQEGPKLQRYLRLKWWTSSNYCTDWWTTYVYLHYRKALPINSSYYVLDQARRLPSTNREARAAVAIHGMLRFRRAVENESLGPVRVGGLVPWCMDQYRRAFGTTRVPGRDADSLVTYPYEESMHVAVLCRGYIYRVETVDARTGRLLNPSKLAEAFEAVAEDAAATELADSEAEAKAEKEDARTPMVGTATGSRSRDEHQDKGAREAEVTASSAPGSHSKNKKHRGSKSSSSSGSALAKGTSSSTGGSDSDSDDDDDDEEEGEQAMREVVTPAARAPPALRRTNTSAGRLLRRTHAYERLVPALTGWDRTSWAAAREQWFSEGVNRRSLEQVESASLFLVLSDETYGADGETSNKKGISDSEYQKSWTMRGRSAMHGNGADRWFDKSIQIVAYGDGHLGYCAEHSWADALAVAHIIEVGSMTAEFRFGMYNPDGTICREAEKTRLWSAEGEQVFNATWKRPKLPKDQEAQMLEDDQMITIRTGRGGEHAAKGGSAGAAQSDGGVTREGTSGTDELDAGTGGAAGSGGSGGGAAEDCGTRTSCLRSDGSPMFRRMQWHLPRGAERDIRSAMRHLKGLSDSVDLQVVSFSDYGKSFVKKCRVSPDAYVQAALQLAYYRDQQGRLDDTYEASVTRVFKEGRTETIRSVSEDSRRFVESMGLLEEGKLEGADDGSAGVTSAGAAVGAGTGGSGTTSGSGQVAWQDVVGEVDGAPIMRSDASRVSAEEGLRRLGLLRSSAKRHGLITARSRAGQGVDRHLFALYVVSKGQEVESPFLAQALGTAWKLSTSQQPQQQTNMWNLKSALDAKMASPGGGFGPVAPDGYGVSYMVQLEGEMFFHISSNRSAPTTDSRRFVRVLRGALLEMRQVLELGLGEGLQAKGKASTGGKKAN